MTGNVRTFTEPNAFHQKLYELGSKTKDQDYQYLPVTGDINAVKSSGKIRKYLGFCKPGTKDQGKSIEAIGKLIAMHVLFLDKEQDLYSLKGLRYQLEDLHLTGDSLYEDLGKVIQIVESDNSANNEVWNIIPREVQLHLLSRLTPAEIQETARNNPAFAVKIRDPIQRAVQAQSAKPVRPQVDRKEIVEQEMQSMNLAILRGVYSPSLESASIRSRIEADADKLKDYYKNEGKTKPEHVNPLFADFEWIDLAFLERKLSGKSVVEI